MDWFITSQVCSDWYEGKVRTRVFMHLPTAFVINYNISILTLAFCAYLFVLRNSHNCRANSHSWIRCHFWDVSGILQSVAIIQTVLLQSVWVLCHSSKRCRKQVLSVSLQECSHMSIGERSLRNKPFVKPLINQCASQQVGTCNFCCDQEVKGTVLFQEAWVSLKCLRLNWTKITIFIHALIFQSQTLRIFILHSSTQTSKSIRTVVFNLGYAYPWGYATS